MSNFDPIMIAQAMEQMETVVDQAASVVWAYYEALQKSGFSDEQAITLTVNFQSVWWAAMLAKRD